MKTIRNLLIISIAFILICSCSGYINWDNSTKVEETSNATSARIDLLPEYVDQGATTISIEATLLNGMNLPIKTIENAYEILSDDNGSYIIHDFEHFGKFQVIATYKNGTEVVGEDSFEYILTSDEYNIALLTATVPATYFSLFMADTDNSYATEQGIGINASLPTIIGMERAASYDWDNLFPNFSTCPFADESLNGQNLDSYEYSRMMEAFKQYIGYLDTLNPESRYHLYINDFDSYAIPHLMLENGISFDRFDVYAITDGTGTAGIFREKYGTGTVPDTSMDFYSRIEETWEKVQKLAISGNSDYENILINISGSNPSANRYMRDFMPVLVNDNDLKITWIMNRNNPDAFGTSEVYIDKIQNNPNVKVINMYNILGSLSDAEIKEFQEMYKFDSAIFKVADESDKGIMIFLGTATTSEEHFRDYLTFMTTYYGDEYVYYYKAHPGFAADYDDNKANLLAELGILNLDAAIPAELFYFFRNDAVMCGYQSSTFTNAEGVEISCIVNSVETYGGRADLTITANGDGTYIVSNIKDHPGTFIWDPSKPEVFPWL